MSKTKVAALDVLICTEDALSGCLQIHIQHLQNEFESAQKALEGAEGGSQDKLAQAGMKKPGFFSKLFAKNPRKKSTDGGELGQVTCRTVWTQCI